MAPAPPVLEYWVADWFGGWGKFLQPGHHHDWVFWGYPTDSAVSVTAVVVGIPIPLTEPIDLSPQVLAVENIRSEVNLVPKGAAERRLLFTVKNVGPRPVNQYHVNFGIIHN
jgi:hypothetical protein